MKGHNVETLSEILVGGILLGISLGLRRGSGAGGVFSLGGRGSEVDEHAARDTGRPRCNIDSLDALAVQCEELDLETLGNTLVDRGSDVWIIQQSDLALTQLKLELNVPPLLLPQLDLSLCRS
jgi:hypothetical protein